MESGNAVEVEDSVGVLVQLHYALEITHRVVSSYGDLSRPRVHQAGREENASRAIAGGVPLLGQDGNIRWHLLTEFEVLRVPELHSAVRAASGQVPQLRDVADT